MEEALIIAEERTALRCELCRQRQECCVDVACAVIFVGAILNTFCKNRTLSCSRCDVLYNVADNSDLFPFFNFQFTCKFYSLFTVLGVCNIKIM